ncbi:MAG: efflux RND transporter periplasmic adaptor subunit [Alphaproteobacteria bacterium]|nr:efflux RND transporter periplasmic adaptor subunit [Alphaproteobacteria bacterium]
MRRAGMTLLLLLLVAAGGGGYYWWSQPAVSLAGVERGRAVHAVYATAAVEAVNWAKVAPLVRGRLAEVCRCEGQAVAKGFVLARLDDAEPRAEVAAMEAKLRFLREEVDRQRILAERKIASEQAFERIDSEFRAAQANLAVAKARLRYFELAAPIDGVVLKRDGEVGEVVDQNSAVFWVGQPTPLWASAEVDEEDIPLVRPGQRVLLKADAFPGKNFAGTVRAITPKGDPVSKSYRVRLDLPDDTPFLLGMTVEANIVVREVADAVLVPSGALRGDRVLQVEQGRIVERAIRRGIAGPERTEVLEGLQPGDTVVARPQESLRPGQRVRLRAGAG